MSSFNHDLAFSRNLGWLSDIDFQDIKNFKICIAGMGGVGGSHLMALIRMGFCNFAIADFDTFEIQNFNRQFGANVKTIGRNKCEVMKELALQVNPQAQIDLYLEGVSNLNINNFLKGVDLYVDGLDLFELEVRQLVFRQARKQGIPCVTSAPLGFGASCMVFEANSMSFDEYFQFKINDSFENVLKFVLGLSPSLMQVKYLVDIKYSNLKIGKTTSTPAGCFLASSIVCTEAIRILLKREGRHKAPTVIHYDLYLKKIKKNYILWGLRNPLLKLKLFVLGKMLKNINESK